MVIYVEIKENKDITISLGLKPTQTFLTNKYKAQASYFKTQELKNILQIKDILSNLK